MAFRKRSVRDADVRRKKVLVRVDLNVPLKDGAVADDTRVRASLPTIALLRERGAAVALCSHLGRPKGRDAKASLMPVAAHLSELLGAPVLLAPDCVGPDVAERVAALSPGGVLLLENVRFHPEEEKNDPAFAAELAAPFDLYVNDAFGAAHRAHASTEGVARLLPAYAGLLLERELVALGGLLERPERPFLAIIGGAKVSSKIGVLRALVERADAIAIGGGMANTFLAATGRGIGRSLSEPDREGGAREILAAAARRGTRVLLPADVVTATSLDAAGEASAEVRDVAEVPADRAIVDVGPRTLDEYATAIADARTIFWNGPLGVFEVSGFAEGTQRVARLLAESGAATVVGGGESVQAVQELGLAERMTHVSTGGGAALELIEGKTLPGVAAIPDGKE
ncbi:MAG TPA: phosphoglycerate kinase [Candidatus Limnocylindrales bacterium]|nr:phosphoglycerate kinase [Candidatus Limnocylindrales bacterium]